MQLLGYIAAALVAAYATAAAVEDKKHHHHHHHGRHGHHGKHGQHAQLQQNATQNAKQNATVIATSSATASEAQIVGRMKALESQLQAKQAPDATAAPPAAAAVTPTASIEFHAQPAAAQPVTASVTTNMAESVNDGAAEAPPCPTTGCQSAIDIDTEMPYGELEPFGREDTAQELTESSIQESDTMVDQLERAEVAEEKRAVFRALTRLRGAAITSFDGVARSQTGNIDEYNKVHKWRSTHPLRHLADEESDVAKWAFPDNADF